MIIAFKTAVRSVRACVHPKSVHTVRMDGKAVEEETVHSVSVYFVVYVLVFFLSLVLVSIDNFDFTTNFTAIAATLNNIGPGLNGVGPMQNFSAFSDFSKIILSLDMLVGRLELYPVLILFSASAWKKS